MYYVHTYRLVGRTDSEKHVCAGPDKCAIHTQKHQALESSFSIGYDTFEQANDRLEERKKPSDAAQI